MTRTRFRPPATGLAPVVQRLLHYFFEREIMDAGFPNLWWMSKQRGTRGRVYDCLELAEIKFSPYDNRYRPIPKNRGPDPAATGRSSPAVSVSY